VQILKKEGKNPDQLFLECNPGPGILTQALLESKAKVIALESNRTFLPHLESLRKKVNGKLEVVYCDFFKMDPRNFGIVKPPIMISETLFRHLGIEAVPWSEGNFCHSLQQIASDLPAFSSRTPCLLKRSASCLDESLWAAALRTVAFSSHRQNPSSSTEAKRPIKERCQGFVLIDLIQFVYLV